MGLMGKLNNKTVYMIALMLAPVFIAADMIGRFYEA